MMNRLSEHIIKLRWTVSLWQSTLLIWRSLSIQRR